MNTISIYNNQQRMNGIKASINYSNGTRTRKVGKKDTLEIAEDSCKIKDMTASSGKDILGITKGDKDNSYVIHFFDSAMVSRAVSRGYIKVNGMELKLSDETKQQLLKTDKQAQADREKAYNEYIMQHEIAVAKQQSEAWKKAFGSMPTGLMQLLEQSKGVNEEAAKRNKQYDNAIKAYGCKNGGVSWSQFEWKTYDTQMTVSVEDTVNVEHISEGENAL